MAIENKNQKYCGKGEPTQSPVNRGEDVVDGKTTAGIWSEWKYKNIYIQMFYKENWDK